MYMHVAICMHGLHMHVHCIIAGTILCIDNVNILMEGSIVVPSVFVGLQQN